VILPHAKKNALPPGLTLQFACLDFRGKFTDLEGLAEGVRVAQRAGRRVLADRGWVFLSYQRIDSERITPLITELERANHRIWWDRILPPGQDWPRDLARAINDSYAFLACFSAASVARSRSYAYPEIDEAI
jgi:hypothetical protein